jgi:aminoglycoside/choline kinase family phosphotransferase
VSPSGAELLERSLDGFSTHAIARVRVRLPDGRRRPAVLKRSRPSPGRDPRREVLVYRRVHALGGHGAPDLYGSVCRTDRSMLLLEDVGDRRLERCGVERWVVAFAFLGARHARWRGRQAELRAFGCLLEHDGRHHSALAEAALRTLRARGGECRARRLDSLLGHCFATTLDVLGRQPRTLVHGDLSGHNVMVQRHGESVSIRPIDWEWAAVGAAGWDVSRLVAGWGAEREVLLGAYLDAAHPPGSPPADRAAFDDALVHSGIMRTLWYLRWWTRALDDPAELDGVLDRLESKWAA